MRVGTDLTGRCALQSLAADEPLAGTAPIARRWVCLEQRGAWPRDVAAHPDPAVRALDDRAAAAGWRLLLIRRPGRTAVDTPLRVVLADAVPRRSRATALEVDGPAELAGLPLPSDGPLPGKPLPDPLLLVCTHGRRDRCCALDGRALVAGLVGAGESEVWESSHLGGHRFAPTSLVLPGGYLHGRLDVAAAITVRAAARRGEVEPVRCRGRSAWSPTGQVAELAVRAATGIREADALHVDAETPRTGGVDVLVVASDGRRWSVPVRPRPGPPRPASCGAVAAPVAAVQAGAPDALFEACVPAGG